MSEAVSETPREDFTPVLSLIQGETPSTAEALETKNTPHKLIDIWAHNMTDDELREALDHTVGPVKHESDIPTRAERLVFAILTATGQLVDTKGSEERLDIKRRVESGSTGKNTPTHHERQRLNGHPITPEDREVIERRKLQEREAREIVGGAVAMLQGIRDQGGIAAVNEYISDTYDLVEDESLATDLFRATQITQQNPSLKDASLIARRIILTMHRLGKEAT